MRLFRKIIKASNVNHFLLEQTQMFSLIVVGLSIHKMVVYSFFFFMTCRFSAKRNNGLTKYFESIRTVLSGGVEMWGGGSKINCKRKTIPKKDLKSYENWKKKSETKISKNAGDVN